MEKIYHGRPSALWHPEQQDGEYHIQPRTNSLEFLEVLQNAKVKTVYNGGRLNNLFVQLALYVTKANIELHKPETSIQHVETK